LLLNIF